MGDMADFVSDDTPGEPAVKESRGRYVYITECYDVNQKRWQPWPDGTIAVTMNEAKMNVAWLEHEHGLTGLKFRWSRYQRVKD